MTRMVPVVVVVPEATADALAELAERDDERQKLHPLRPVMARSGWTNEMVLGGVLLRQAVDLYVGEG